MVMPSSDHHHLNSQAMAVLRGEPMIPTPTNTENLLPDSCSASVMAFVCSSTWRLIPTIPIQVPHMGRCIVLAPKDCPVSLGTTGSQPTCLPVSAVVWWVKVTRYLSHFFSSSTPSCRCLLFLIFITKMRKMQTHADLPLGWGGSGSREGG